MPTSPFKRLVFLGLSILTLFFISLITRPDLVPNIKSSSSDSFASSDGSARSQSKLSNTDLIQIVYHENTDSAENLRFFLKHALHDRADFVFVINGDALTVEIPMLPNVMVIRRPNTCYDLGAHGEVLDNRIDIKKYRRFILLNSTVRGPFLPYWVHMMNFCWSDLFFNQLNSKTKLIGLTANCNPHTHWNVQYNLTNGLPKHIQSAFFATDHIGMDLLFPNLKACFSDMIDAVIHAETTLTDVILQAGYGVDIFSMQRMSKRLELDTVDYWDACDNNDPNSASGAMEIHPFDVIFPKTNRLTPASRLTVDTLSTWMNASGYTSFEACSARL